jgi:SAM-dependent methyltransferase
VSNEGTVRGFAQDELWRGVDLSGNTLLIGLGEGHLAEALALQGQRSGTGYTIALGDRQAELARIASSATGLPLGYVNGRLRALPFVDESIDLVVLNGSLRQVRPNALLPFFEQVWRVMVPGGAIRIADVLEPSEAPYNEAWRIYNGIIETVARSLGRSTALYASLQTAAAAMASIGFDDLNVTLLPGLPLTDAWLEHTEEAVMAMASRLVDTALRDRVLTQDVRRLISAYRSGEQRAAERFVLRGTRVGNLALDMRASFTEEDLQVEDDD